jgi:integrase/recombinase XerD
MNTECNLTKRVRIGNELRYCPVVLTANGRVKQDYVYEDGKHRKKPAQHPEGAYYIEWREGNRRKRLSVGNDATEAYTQRLRKEAELKARNNGVAVAATEERIVRPLDIAVMNYLHEVSLHSKPKTLSAYTKALAHFRESCMKRHVEDITRLDMLEFAAFLRDKKDHAPRTVSNNFEHVMTFIKAQGIHKLVGKRDRPVFTLEEPEVYEREELDALFAACDAEERLWFEFFLMTGMREQEVMYTYWRDVNFNTNTVRVTHKPDRGWTPKAYKEREIPIPDKLVVKLKAWKAKSDKKCNLVFSTKGCSTKLDFLDCLKAVANGAGLNCGNCEGCEKSEGAKCGNFYLHKFRATFATWALWKGVDLRTVQSWMGHKDMESTMRYLKPSRSKETRAKVNAIFA